MKNKVYSGLSEEVEVGELNEIVDELCDERFEGEVGLSEVCGLICGEGFYEDWDEEDLEYVKEVMEELCKLKVGFNLERECMYVIEEVG